MIVVDRPRPHGWLKALAITQIVFGGLAALGAIARWIEFDLLRSSPLSAEQAGQYFFGMLGQATVTGLLLLGGILILRGKRSGVTLSKILHGLFAVGFLAAGVMMALDPDVSLLFAVGYALFWGGTFFGLPLLYLIKSKQVSEFAPLR